MRLVLLLVSLAVNNIVCDDSPREAYIEIESPHLTVVDDESIYEGIYGEKITVKISCWNKIPLPQDERRRIYDLKVLGRGGSPLTGPKRCTTRNMDENDAKEPCVLTFNITIKDVTEGSYYIECNTINSISLDEKSFKIKQRPGKINMKWQCPICYDIREQQLSVFAITEGYPNAHSVRVENESKSILYQSDTNKAMVNFTKSELKGITKLYLIAQNRLNDSLVKEIDVDFVRPVTSAMQTGELSRDIIIIIVVVSFVVLFFIALFIWYCRKNQLFKKLCKCFCFKKENDIESWERSSLVEEDRRKEPEAHSNLQLGQSSSSSDVKMIEENKDVESGKPNTCSNGQFRNKDRCLKVILNTQIICPHGEPSSYECNDVKPKHAPTRVEVEEQSLTSHSTAPSPTHSIQPDGTVLDDADSMTPEPVTTHMHSLKTHDSESSESSGSDLEMDSANPQLVSNKIYKSHLKHVDSEDKLYEQELCSVSNPKEDAASLGSQGGD